MDTNLALFLVVLAVVLAIHAVWSMADWAQTKNRLAKAETAGTDGAAERPGILERLRSDSFGSLLRSELVRSLDSYASGDGQPVRAARASIKAARANVDAIVDRLQSAAALLARDGRAHSFLLSQGKGTFYGATFFEHPDPDEAAQRAGLFVDDWSSHLRRIRQGASNGRSAASLLAILCLLSADLREARIILDYCGDDAGRPEPSVAAHRETLGEFSRNGKSLRFQIAD